MHLRLVKEFILLSKVKEENFAFEMFPRGGDVLNRIYA